MNYVQGGMAGTLWNEEQNIMSDFPGYSNEQERPSPKHVYLDE